MTAADRFMTIVIVTLQINVEQCKMAADANTAVATGFPKEVIRNSERYIDFVLYTIDSPKGILLTENRIIQKLKCRLYNTADK